MVEQPAEDLAPLVGLLRVRVTVRGRVRVSVRVRGRGMGRGRGRGRVSGLPASTARSSGVAPLKSRASRSASASRRGTTASAWP